MVRKLGILAAVAVAMAAGPTLAWDETDFPPRPIVAYGFVPDGPEVSTLIGVPRSYTFNRGDTLYDVARHMGLGINETSEAFPEVDVWLPPEGESLAFPTFWILPESDGKGVVVNIPEMRLYYFPPASRGRSPTVVTYPVGLGRDEWRTPTGKFKVTEKTIDPTWVIPESIRAEHIKERGDPRKQIPGGAPDNPLGHFRIRLSLPTYGIHGTNIPWGVGMEVSHGCVRLYPEDIQRLFGIVSVGAVGEIVYQPVKIGARDGDVYAEVHRDVYDTGVDYVNAAKEMLRDKGWENVIDWGLLMEALSKKSGVPTRISFGQPLHRLAAEGPTEAHRRAPRALPRS